MSEASCFELSEDGRTIDIFGWKGHVHSSARLNVEIRDAVAAGLHSVEKPGGDLRFVVAPADAAQMFDCGFLNPKNLARATPFVQGDVRGFDIALNSSDELDPLARSWPSYGLTTIRVISHGKGRMVEVIESAAGAA